MGNYKTRAFFLGILFGGGEVLGLRPSWFLKVCDRRVVVGVAFPSGSMGRCTRKAATVRVTRDVDSHLTRRILTTDIGNRV